MYTLLVFSMSWNTSELRQQGMAQARGPLAYMNAICDSNGSSSDSDSSSSGAVSNCWHVQW
jgi:hypothetical protein